MPVPGPSDRLANQREPRQTFKAFVNSRPCRPDARRRVLYLQPLGTWEPDDGPSLGQLRQFTAAFFEMDVAILPVLDLVHAGITSRRNPWSRQVQLLTSDILNLLKRRLPEDAFALLGITMSFSRGAPCAAPSSRWILRHDSRHPETEVTTARWQRFRSGRFRVPRWSEGSQRGKSGLIVCRNPSAALKTSEESHD